MRKSLLFTIQILFCVNLFLNAQQGDTLQTDRNLQGKISFARFSSSANIKIADAPNFLKNFLHLKSGEEFQLKREMTDELGFLHKRYQLFYKGVKVDQAEYLVHGKNGTISAVNGNYVESDINAVLPVVTSRDALNHAISFINAKKYKWQDSVMERLIKESTKDPNASYYPVGELVIARDTLVNDSRLRLAWKFAISSLMPNNEQLVYVDAITGNIIRVTSLISDVNVPCTAQTRYTGLVSITGDTYTGGVRLRETRNGVDILTLNLLNDPNYNYGAAVDFTNTGTNWVQGNWATFAQDQQALDAHWGAEKVLDYWSTIHNRNSINGSGLRVLGYVHAGSGWANAQWIPGSSNFMQYGDGDGVVTPLTSLDICAHEFGHGIAQFTAGFTPGYTEEGALNEGFSDIWGACIEYYAAPTKQTWLIGEEFLSATFFTCIRNLQNPKTTTAIEGQHPDTYHGTFWSTNAEPHANSTVLSHWFYLLCQGGSGTNDIGSVYSVSGIGINDAQKIAYRAEAIYLHPGATYADARNATIQAATDLFGACSSQQVAVTNGWFAVGVGNAYAPLTTPILTAVRTSLTGQPTNYKYTATIISNATYTWYVIGQLNNPQQTGSSNEFTWYFPCNVTKSIYCVVTACGGSATSESDTETGECRGHSVVYTLSPNPASNTVKVASATSEALEKTTTVIEEIRIFDQQGNLKKTQKFQKAQAVDISLSELNKGVYFIQITGNGNSEMQQLLIQR